jgi:signal transduction histidine kinase
LQVRLFNQFDRLDADRWAVAGPGVGLAICRHFIEGTGGQIGIESVLGLRPPRRLASTSR